MFLFDGTQWLACAGGALPPFQSGPLASRTLDIAQTMDATPVIGVKVYAGYGRDENEMIGRQPYTLVYTITP